MFGTRSRHYSMENEVHRTSDEPNNISYELIKQITNDFSRDQEIGSGGFGTVYKAVYENGEEIAVKVLRYIPGRDEEFEKELNILRRLKHQNIVDLVGFCYEKENVLVEHNGEKVTAMQMHKALCFEYAQNGNLAMHISVEHTGLNWTTRYNIIKGTCEGLKYLHEGLEHPIVHLDLKPDNILLDKDMVPKITDFGLSRLLGIDTSHSPVGTLGYMPPEYINNQIISKEFDIFSLGVVILKVITGREGYKLIADMTSREFVKHVLQNWWTSLSQVFNPSAPEVYLYCNQVKICVKIALDCINRDRHKRPTMQYIVSSLNDTETMIGYQQLRKEQFYQDGGEPPMIPPSESFHTAVNARHISIELLKTLTNNFSAEQLLGEGAYGKLYKGVYEKQDVAVRMLSQGLSDKQLEHGIAKLSNLHHQNILQFIGYSSETQRVTVEKNGIYTTRDDNVKATCFEYVQNGSLDQYFSGKRSGLDYWSERYRIIKGICEGIGYLHAVPILHMDLKPRNILLDGDMAPKISDICMSRLFYDGNNNRTVTRTVKGTTRYMPPEFRERQVISEPYDIYSLGVLIMDIITGGEGYDENKPIVAGDQLHKKCRKVYNSWRKRLQETVKATTSVEGYCKQVQTCLEIAVTCVREKRAKRPAIGDILHELNKTERLIPRELLEIHPLELFFLPLLDQQPSARNGKGATISCPLQLNNKGNDDSVVFMLVASSPNRYLTRKPICGVVPPRCAYTIALTLTNNKRTPSSDSVDDDFFTLHCVEVGRHEHLRDIEQRNLVAINPQYQDLFKKAKEKVADQVQEVKLKAIYDRPAQGTSSSSSSEPTRSIVEIITTLDAQQVSSIDVHTTEPWIMTAGPRESLRVWNYNDTMSAVNSFQLPDEPVHVAKFIPREKWIVAGDADGSIHVYSYEQDQEVERLDDAHESCITCLAVHPTHPFVLSSSSSSDGDADDDHVIKLWDWEKGWRCTQTFHGHDKKVTQLTFNPEDTDYFVTASLDGKVMIWEISSGDIFLTMDEYHQPGLLGVDYFTRSNVKHLVAGCEDKTAKIWDLRTEECVDKLEGHAEGISAVGLHPELPLLITCSLDGTVRLWNSTTYKLENIIGFNLGAVYAFGFIKGSRRIVVGCHRGIAVMEIPLP